jgi:hypothetical protein
VAVFAITNKAGATRGVSVAPASIPTDPVNMMPDNSNRPLIVLMTNGSEAHDPEAQVKLAWRRQADATGTCPVCGATMRQPNRAERRAATRRFGAGVVHVVMAHASDCPVADGPLERLAS